MRICLFASLDGNLDKKNLINEIQSIAQSGEHEFLVGFFSSDPAKKKTIKSTEHLRQTFITAENEDLAVKEFLLSLSSNENAIIIRTNAVIKNYEFLQKLVSKFGGDSQIITVKEKQTQESYKSKFRTFMSKLLNLVFGFSLYAGNSCIVALEQNVVKSLRTMPNKIARLTKIDALIGFSKSAITAEISFLPYKLTKKQKTSVAITVCLFAIILSLWIVLSLCVPKVNTVVFHLTCIMITIVLVCIMFLNFLKIYTHKEVGDLIA